jgi:hypothetical protein
MDGLDDQMDLMDPRGMLTSLDLAEVAIKIENRYNVSVFEGGKVLSNWEQILDLLVVEFKSKV